MLPEDTKARRAAALDETLRQTEVDEHFAKQKLEDKPQPYSDKLFEEAAIRWLIETDQVRPSEPSGCFLIYLSTGHSLYRRLNTQPTREWLKLQLGRHEGWTFPAENEHAKRSSRHSRSRWRLSVNGWMMYVFLCSLLAVSYLVVITVAQTRLGWNQYHLRCMAGIECGRLFCCDRALDWRTNARDLEVSPRPFRLRSNEYFPQQNSTWSSTLQGL